MAQRTSSDSSADEDEFEDDVNDDDDVDEDETGADEDENDEDEEGEKPPKSRRDRRIEQLSKESARYRIKARNATKRVTELEAELEKIKKDGVTDEATKASLAEIPTLREENEDLKDQIKTFRVGDAIRNEMNELNLNPRRARAILKQIDLEDIEVEDDGEVSGVREALEKVAQDFPEWVIRSQGDDDDDKGTNGRTSGQSSRKPGTSNRKKPQLDKNKLAAQFPALAGTYIPQG